MIIRPATIADALALMPDLRPWDKKEIELLTGKKIFEALPQQVTHAGECYAVYTARRVIALFGLTPVDKITARVGLICSRQISKHKLFLIKFARRMLWEWLHTYRILFNIVAIKNRIAIRWLKKIGAKFVGEKILINKVPFITFTITKESLCVR